VGVEGARFIKSKLGTALKEWRTERAALKEELRQSEQNLVKGVDNEIELILNEADKAEKEAGLAAVKYVDEHPNVIKPAKPGERRAKVSEDHEIVEVPDPSAPTGISCEYHSNGGPRVPCPRGMGISGAREARSYHIIGDRKAIADSQMGFQVYEYRNQAGDLLYVGKSGGAGGKKPNSWINRLQDSHIKTEWIGEANTVTVTYGLTEQESLALEEVLIPGAKYNKKLGEHSSRFPQGGTSANAVTASKKGSVARFKLDVLF